MERLPHSNWHSPPRWLGLLGAVVLVLVTVLVNVSRIRPLPIAYGVPLVLLVFLRSRKLLWIAVACFIAAAVVRAMRLGGFNPSLSTTERWLTAVIRAADTIAVAAVVHAVIVLREAHERRHAELRQLNSALGAREALLASFLEISNSVERDLPVETLIGRLCQAIAELFPMEVSGVAIVQRDGERLAIRGQYGLEDLVATSWPFQNSLASAVISSGQPESVEDLRSRPELRTPQNVGQSIRSVLAAPLSIRLCRVGAIELLSKEPRRWTAEQFALAEWLAGYASLILESSELQIELDQRRRDAEEEAARKTRFLSAVSHDIRTPANAISLTSELLTRAMKGPVAGEQVQELARDLRGNALSLVGLVSDVLDMTRLDASVRQFEPVQFGLDEFISEQYRQHQPEATAKGLELRVESPGELMTLNTDRPKLARTVGNLLANAIKFTSAGQVRLAASVDEEGQLLLAVRDTGVGIAPQQLGRIFDEFYQIQNPERDRAKGTGLGLAIARRLSRVLGGDIMVESTPGKGSTFTLHLPASAIVARSPRAGPAEAPAAAPLRRAGSLTGLRVLLVEDHETTRRATSSLLASEGAIVHPAPDGGAGLERLRLEIPDVLLLDLMLPDMDGREILRHLQSARPPDLKRIFAMTGDLTPDRIREVHMLGADGLIPKPVNVDRLVDLLASAR